MDSVAGTLPFPLVMNVWRSCSGEIILLSVRRLVLVSVTYTPKRLIALTYNQLMIPSMLRGIPT